MADTFNNINEHPSTETDGSLRKTRWLTSKTWNCTP